MQICYFQEVGSSCNKRKRNNFVPFLDNIDMNANNNELELWFNFDFRYYKKNMKIINGYYCDCFWDLWCVENFETVLSHE